ncbi:MAG: quinol dehydrogenase ferredoxin subunit NapH [Magnetococcales bacterium]|nr:quinol dehydrogenase ferredoxin subunit NapH [Magnetococcales bacterium]
MRPPVKLVASGDGVREKGWWRAYQWLILRRLSQLTILALFLAGPWFGVRWVEGNLSSSLTLNTLPLTDVLIFLQILVSGHWPASQAVLGFVIVVVFYMLVGGRVFCAWACPVNMITDLARWARGKLGIRRDISLPRSTRYGVLIMLLLVTALSGMLVWEWVNPVAMVHRGLIFGMGAGWLVVVAIFLFDLFISRNGWCGRLCPTGAVYSLCSTTALVRVEAARRDQCNDCQDCFLVCPEPQVIGPALKGEAKGIGPVIHGINCSNCGRCIDICSKSVYRFAIHIPNRSRIAS